MLLVHPSDNAPEWLLSRATAETPIVLAEPEAVEEIRKWSAARGATSIGTPPTYHQETRDHPFLDMSRGMESMADDAEIMAGYLQNDTHPCLTLPIELSSEGKVVLPRAADVSIDELRHHPLATLVGTIAATYGATRVQHGYTDPYTEYTQPEVLRKAVPSGGSRHPTECLLSIVRHPSVARGYYYFHPMDNALYRLSHCVRQLIDADYVGNQGHIEVHQASYVHRAMFRYRDPRSFRALLVDAGHADALLASFAAFMNLHYEATFLPDLQYGAGLPWLQSDREDQNRLPLLTCGVLSW